MPKPSLTSDKTSYKAARRGKFEIWSALLEACLRTPRTQSWLMRKVGLNTAAAKEALSILTSGGLLEQESEPTAGIFEYKTTEKGKAALAQYYQLIASFFGTRHKSRVKQYMIVLLFALSSCFVYGQIVFRQMHSFLAGDLE
ncbi:MAG: winged helix-turn-helix domain-containing protein [Candidatus Hermodarchaeota archaeon]|nr:winged helix-turn-helix domain-containing protein [Candidatus Hermodarchaeota archaeon]